MDASAQNRLISVTLDENSIGRGSADQEHERAIAVYDLIEDNSFALVGYAGGPYALNISLMDAKLVFDIRDQNGNVVVTHILSLTPFRRILKDYFFICESYYAAIRTATPSRIEAIDMGRRGLHNEGAQLLAERLKGKIETDADTSRRLFTLITALHWKG
ncbi:MULTISPECIES: UPF0262 family protein [Methylocystis]|uniref:UPF0262 protein SS37A_13110 n=1 Tax=Methylocystis iwaonis TaxID=2885079 RepID=A0ABM8E746_9HYPH|nr:MULTISPECIES: UPF0262 family protein [Methylocystis]MBL1258312.1 UPF0262 family protein [Methylocystis sp. Sn-Cys]MDJ0447192.1 UPF0262 family protein [Methylocystis sp. JR02]BDV33782.1 UPF0262 protein [Methylocystis iwaonis]